MYNFDITKLNILTASLNTAFWRLSGFIGIGRFTQKLIGRTLLLHCRRISMQWWCNDYNETKGAFLLVDCAKASFWLVGFVVMEPLAYPAHPAFFFQVRNSVCWLSELKATKKKRQKILSKCIIKWIHLI